MSEHAKMTFELPAASEFFHAGDILGMDSGVVRLKQTLDPFAGIALETEDRTLKAVGAFSFDRLGTSGTIKVGLGLQRIRVADGVTVVIRGKCYWVNITTWTHTRTAGNFIGIVTMPWVEHEDPTATTSDWYIIDTTPGYIAAAISAEFDVTP